MWTVERIASLKSMWAQGLSATAMGAVLDVSRNAVIGKAHRIGLSLSDRTTAGRVPRQATPRRIIVGRRKSLLDRAEALDKADVRAEAVTFGQLESHHCRWPLGEPGTAEFRFCGASKMDESSYCSLHHRIGYTKPQARKPQPYFYRKEA